MTAELEDILKSLVARYSYQGVRETLTRLVKSGDMHPTTKLTDEEVKGLYVQWKKGGLTQQEIADIYGINRSTLIRRFRRLRNLD